jgi:hypothetical protein
MVPNKCLRTGEFPPPAQQAQRPSIGSERRRPTVRQDDWAGWIGGCVVWAVTTRTLWTTRSLPEPALCHSGKNPVGAASGAARRINTPLFNLVSLLLLCCSWFDVSWTTLVSSDAKLQLRQLSRSLLAAQHTCRSYRCAHSVVKSVWSVRSYSSYPGS